MLSGNADMIVKYRIAIDNTLLKQLLASELVVFLHFVCAVTLSLQQEIVNMGDPSKLDPLELLTNKGTREPTFLSPIWNPILGGAFGVGAALFSNWGVRKPVFSGKCAARIACCDVTLFLLNI